MARHVVHPPLSSTFRIISIPKGLKNRGVFLVSIPSQEQVTLLTDYDAGSTYSTAYQTLYANIRFNWDSERVKQQTIAITTPTAIPRQSEVVANVAIAAAQNGTPTIVVDANFRTPSLQQRFSLGESK